MKLKTRILTEVLLAFLAFILFISVVFFISMSQIRDTVIDNSKELGDSAVSISFYAMEEQITESIARTASDIALILDEKILKIENQTLMLADIAGSIYTYKASYGPYPLSVVESGGISPSEPYLHTAPGVELSRIKSETDLVGNIKNVLRQISVVNRGISTSSIGGESGYIIAMDASPTISVNYDPRARLWYQGAKQRGNLFWTGLYADIRGRGAVVSCAMPFYDQSGGGKVFKGVAQSTALLTDISKMIDSTNVGQTGYLFLLDNTGLKLFSSGNMDVKIDEQDGVHGENYLESNDPRIHSLGLSMTLGASGMTELDIDGLPVYVAYAPIRTLGWSLGVAIPAQEIGEPARLIQEQIPIFTNNAMKSMNRHISRILGIIGVMLFLLMVMSALFSLKFTKNITAPIISLNDGIQEISVGNMDREVRIKTGDEIEQLADSFNAMTARLQKHIEQIASNAAEKERIATELDIATRIQTSLLPYNFTPFDNREKDFDLYAIMRPAKEVGGDFYDFFFIDDDHFVFSIADVAGKGIPAALFMALTKTMIKDHIQSGKPINAALEAVNRQLCGNNAADMFVTLWIGMLEISSGRLEYVNAGHNPPLLKTRENRFEFLTSTPDLVLAVLDGTVYHICAMKLENNDTLYLYTDGVTEAANPQKNLYGMDRLRKTLDANANAPVRELLPLILADIQTFSAQAEQSDDITMMALRINRGTEHALKYITLPADITKLEELTGFIEEELKETECPETVKHHIQLAVEEIFVNIALYAYIPDCGKVKIACEIAESSPTDAVHKKTITLTFTDQGRQYNPLNKPDPDINIPLKERPIGGLGILMVKRIMDTVEYVYDQGTNRLSIKKSW